MILSLEDEEEADLQDVTQNVITVDDEYLNGPMLGRSKEPSEKSILSSISNRSQSKDPVLH